MSEKEPKPLHNQLHNVENIVDHVRALQEQADFSGINKPSEQLGHQPVEAVEGGAGGSPGDLPCLNPLPDSSVHDQIEGQAGEQELREEPNETGITEVKVPSKVSLRRPWAFVTYCPSLPPRSRSRKCGDS